jgi:hypothetical protein
MKIAPYLLAGIVVTAGTSHAVIVNLTNVTIAGETPDTMVNVNTGSTFRGGFINGALFRDPSVEGSAGSGTFRDLYRISPPNGQANVVEEGYNRPGVLNTSIPNGFDPYLTMSDLIQDASQSSYIFVVDLNESNSSTDRYLSVDDLKIWVGGTTDPAVLPNSLPAAMTALGVPAYDMNPSGQQNFALLDSTLSSGSGGGDLFVFVPKSFFPQNADPNAFVYIYTKMGSYTGAPGFGAGATQEQISIPGKSISDGSNVSTITSGLATIPEPSTFAGLVAAGLFGLVRRRR